MILSKAGRLFLLAGFVLLLMGFAGTSYGAVRFDVFPSPTEVIVTGRSEVLGNVNMVVDTLGAVSFTTGSSAGGPAQIGVIYGNGIQIDNLDTRGIKIFYSTNFNPAPPTIVQITNSTANGRCSGFITINVPAGLTVVTGDFIRLEGVRGRIDLSDGGVGPGVDLFVGLQSINDPAAYSFVPDSVRISHTLDPIEVAVSPATMLLCFPSTGVASAGILYPSFGASPFTTYNIQARERFQRAFVSQDAGAAGADINDRLNSSNGLNPTVFPAGGYQILGAPTNATQLTFVLNSIPKSVASVSWPSLFYNDQLPNISNPQPVPAPVPVVGSNASTLSLVSSTFTAATTNTTNDGIAVATYTFYSYNQVGYSDVNIESFYVNPLIILSTTNQQVIGTPLAAVTLAPAAESIAGGSCTLPASSVNTSQPRFVTKYISGAAFTSQYASFTRTDPNFSVYANIIRCNCYLLFPFITKIPPGGGLPGWTTGIAVANTSNDSPVFAAGVGAPNQQGLVNFYFYDKTLGFVGQTVTTALVQSGQSFVADLSQMLPTGVTTFSGYMIAAAQFQYCHGYAFISDPGYGLLAQGYVAGVIPDPAIKAGSRQPSAASDFTNGGKGVPAGESLNF